MNRGLGLIAALVFAGASCAPAEPARTGMGDAPRVEPAASSAPIMPGLRWETVVSGAGAGLILLEPDGSPVLRLSCVRGPATITVTGERFRAIGSEERLTLGVGGEAYTFVADPTEGRRTGVEGRAPISDALLERLASADAVSAVYGDQRIGPHIPPDPQSARMFARACREVRTADARALPRAAPAVVPARFRGEWNMNPADCGTGLNDSRLVIGADQVRFYEGGGPVTAVREAGADTVELTVALSGEGEGPTPTTYGFRLTEGGSALVTDGGSLTRRRCPAAATEGRS